VAAEELGVSAGEEVAMDRRIFVRATLVAIVAGACYGQTAKAQESLANRILSMSEAEQIAHAKSFLDSGM
jgi:hypothetical protein